MLENRRTIAAGDVVMRRGRAYVVVTMMRRTMIVVPVVVRRASSRQRDPARAQPGIAVADLASGDVVFRCGRLVLGSREDFVRAGSVSLRLFARISERLRLAVRGRRFQPAQPAMRAASGVPPGLPT